MKKKDNSKKNNHKNEIRIFLDAAFSEEDVNIHDPEFKILSDIFYEPTDRGCILVGCSYIDHALGELIRSKCGNDNHIVKVAVEPLLELPMAPLKSYWARVNLVYALGLITRNTYEALDEVRKLRNQCAHYRGPITLSGTEVNKILGKLPILVRKLCKGFGAFTQKTVEEGMAEFEAGVKQVQQMGLRFKMDSPRSLEGLRKERIQLVLALIFLYAEICQKASN